MKITRQLLALAGVGAMASVGAFASANPARQSSTSVPSRVQQIEKVLSMTPQQKTETETAVHQAWQSAKPIRQDLKNTNQSLKSAVEANNTTKIQQLANKEGQDIGKLLAIRSSAVAKVYNTLTPAQQQRADALQSLMMRSFHQQMAHPRARS